MRRLQRLVDGKDLGEKVNPTPYTLHPTLFTLHPAPYTLHPAPYTLHPTLHILHPTLYTLHPALYTLHLSLHRCRANVAYTGQSRPDRDLGFQVKVIKTHNVVPALLGSGIHISDTREQGHRGS